MKKAIVFVTINFVLLSTYVTASPVRISFFWDIGPMISHVIGHKKMIAFIKLKGIRYKTKDLKPNERMEFYDEKGQPVHTLDLQPSDFPLTIDVEVRDATLVTPKEGGIFPVMYAGPKSITVPIVPMGLHIESIRFTMENEGKLDFLVR